MRKLRAAGAGLGLQERGGHTALHLACREGQPHCAQHLLGGLRCPLSEEERAQLESVNYDGKVGVSKGGSVGRRHLGARQGELEGRTMVFIRGDIGGILSIQ